MNEWLNGHEDIHKVHFSKWDLVGFNGFTEFWSVRNEPNDSLACFVQHLKL